MGLRRVVHEVHRRFLWQALIIYLIIAFIAYRISLHIAARNDLPAGFGVFAVVLLLVGLPVILVTAAVQEGIPTMGRSDPTIHIGLAGSSSSPQITIRPKSKGLQSIFTWRNAIFGGVAAFTIWAIVALGWLLVAAELVG